MATEIQLKRSSVIGKVPDGANVLVGEPVVNLADKILYTKDGTGNVIVIGSGTTSNVTEGSNLYYTNARVYSNVIQLGYATNSNVALKANVADLTTTNVSEGTNLYFTNTRSRQSISVTGSGSYNSGTGVITISGVSGGAEAYYQTFTANGAGSTYDLSFGLFTANAALVFVNSVLQEQGNNYSVSGNTITFVTPPEANAIVDVRSVSGLTGPAGASGNVTLADNTTSSATFYPTLSSSNTGSYTTATVSSTKLYFVPSTGTLNATIFNSLSDISLKDNVSRITDAVSIVNRIEGVEFVWKESGIKASGVIAQDLEQVLPFLVSANQDGVKTVNYDGIIAYLIEANKELLKRVEQLESKLNKFR